LGVGKFDRKREKKTGRSFRKGKGKDGHFSANRLRKGHPNTFQVSTDKRSCRKKRYMLQRIRHGKKRGPASQKKSSHGDEKKKKKNTRGHPPFAQKPAKPAVY